jgi:hypothetical protein
MKLTRPPRGPLKSAPAEIGVGALGDWLASGIERLVLELRA